MAVDWYERRNELECGQVFRCADGEVVKLDQRVAGDGTRWQVAEWRAGYTSARWGTVPGGWAYDDGTIEPGELVERLGDDYAGAQ